jgi:prepilin peptidase CpaA
MPDSHCLRFCAVMVSLELAIYIAWALAVVLFDCLRRRIPNALIAAGALCALALAAARLSPFDTAPASALTGAAIGGIALLPFWFAGTMGAADVKAFAALGLWCGPRALVGIWVAASLAAFVHALVLLFGMHRKPGVASSDVSASEPSAARSASGTPYGALLALASLGYLALHALEMQP